MEEVRSIPELHYELLGVIDKLKGMDSLLDVFYENMIRNPGDIDNDKDKYIDILSVPYATMMDNLKRTITSLDSIYDRMDTSLVKLRQQGIEIG